MDGGKDGCEFWKDGGWSRKEGRMLGGTWSLPTIPRDTLHRSFDMLPLVLCPRLGVASLGMMGVVMETSES